MSWIKIDYICIDCGEHASALRKRSEDLDSYTCNCGGEMARQFSTNICRVSHPDGVNNRFAGAREKRAIERQIQQAKEDGDTWMANALKEEKAKVNIKGEALNICKAEE